ncbi:type II toxin-antitoxin system RelB/DinJ family antitoxin [Xenorhabdus japonica]|uniref:DNA-damage-inducible protein J n=1 Tax=Xenorhabdus japonica TaxID=53341 RepID=A0A1I4YAF6_9GAMM|nr:type II toxin-antitoxin system RelB/DinJ family antitoxin [Xenorhabdus japonica]SFN34580.1 DNA-damage-inducible protein J [Xenorhabdus japonica]
MAANAFVRARIDETLKNEAAEVLADMGLTVSDLIRITLTKVAKEKALPFDMRIPNELTAKTIADSEKGIDIHKAKDADDLFNQLGWVSDSHETTGN